MAVSTEETEDEFFRRVLEGQAALSDEAGIDMPGARVDFTLEGMEEASPVGAEMRAPIVPASQEELPARTVRAPDALAAARPQAPTTPDDMELALARAADRRARGRQAFERGARELVGAFSGQQAAPTFMLPPSREEALLGRRRATAADELRKRQLENEAARTEAYLRAQEGAGAGRDTKAELERARAALRERELDIKEEQGAKRAEQTDEELRLKAIKAMRPAGKGGGKSGGSGDVDKLRREFNSMKQVKDFGEVQAQYEKVKATAGDPSAAGDLSAIFAYMKMLDPGSTVREGEFANAEKAAGVPERVLNHYNRVLKGERLAPEQRADFVRQAEKLYGVHRKQYAEQVARYRGLAQKRGADPDDVIAALVDEAPAVPKKVVGTDAAPKTVQVRHKATGKTKSLSPEAAAKYLASPDFEEVK